MDTDETPFAEVSEKTSFLHYFSGLPDHRQAGNAAIGSTLLRSRPAGSARCNSRAAGQSGRRAALLLGLDDRNPSRKVGNRLPCHKFPMEKYGRPVVQA